MTLSPVRWRDTWQPGVEWRDCCWCHSPLSSSSLLLSTTPTHSPAKMITQAKRSSPLLSSHFKPVSGSCWCWYWWSSRLWSSISPSHIKQYNEKNHHHRSMIQQYSVTLTTIKMPWGNADTGSTIQNYNWQGRHQASCHYMVASYQFQYTSTTHITHSICNIPNPIRIYTIHNNYHNAFCIICLFYFSVDIFILFFEDYNQCLALTQKPNFPSY